MADNGIHKYCLGTAVLRRALLEGFALEQGGRLRTVPAVRSEGRRAFLAGLDSAVDGCAWGRFSAKYELDAEAVLCVRAFASNQNSIIRGDSVVRIDDFLLNPDIPSAEKERLFLLAGGIERNGGDALLDGLEGRYLWLWLEINGGGDAVLENIRVYVPGDNFFHTLPQVYQNDNDFLRRYMTVLSTLYQEFQEEINDIPALLDVDTAPEILLPVFASWLGLETDEALFSGEELRKLLKAAPALLERKGSRWAVESVVKLFVDDPTYVVERNLLSSEQAGDATLYGDSPFDFTVMVDCKMENRLRLRLQFLIDQFKPIRSRSRIVFLKDCGGLDAFTYLDMNGSVLESAPGNLDDDDALAGMTYLQ